VTLAEAISQVEAMFTVHAEIGAEQPYTDQNGDFVKDGPCDMSLAPCGEPYVTVTSHGVGEDAFDISAMFASQSLAVQWWFDEVVDWKKRTDATHLYWRHEPEFFATTYLAMDQAGLFQTASPLKLVTAIELGWVQAEMLISKLDPDGKET
jgi:hypothetical protein